LLQEIAMFRDRQDAGEQLARRLGHFQGRKDLLVLGAPPGGMVVAKPVAESLGAELDALMVRRLCVPFHAELAMGAVSLGGARVLNAELIRKFDIPTEVVDHLAQTEREELRRRAMRYRRSTRAPRVEGRPVIIVEEGLATGIGTAAAISLVRQEGASEIVLAAPVAPTETEHALRAVADAVVCLKVPSPFVAVGIWYADFHEVSDEEVRALLGRSDREPMTAAAPRL
jgi:putative phosphoribosyl transferase